MKIKEIIEISNSKLIKGNLEDEIGKLCIDSRIVEKGNTYIGIKGEKSDGNKYWEEAIKNGATTIIVEGIEFNEEKLNKVEQCNIILAENVRQTLYAMAIYKREKYENKIPIIGITGSVGKTSTKDMIANVTMQKYQTLKTQGNRNSTLGVPLTILDLENHEAAVVEIGINQIDEMEFLSKIVKPTISVITNIGTSHIGNLGSRENILKCKLDILQGMEKKVLVMNNDNDLLHKAYIENELKDIEVHTYGIENDSEFMAKDIIITEDSSEFTCKIEGKEQKIKIPVAGSHFIYNALSAIAVGTLVGLDGEEIKKGIETFTQSKKRMEIEHLKNGVTLINDSYNSSLESVQAALKYLTEQEGRKIAVLGDIFELGEFAKGIHEKIGKEISNQNIDILICSGENSKYIVEKAKEKSKNKKIYYFQDKNEIKDFIINNWKKGDKILIKASNGMKFFEIAESLLNY